MATRPAPPGSTEEVLVDDGQPVALAPEVTLVVHEIDSDAHPAFAPGTWRWAVHVGGRPPHEVDYCVQAGGERSRGRALDVGDQTAAAVTQALRIFGIPAGQPGLLPLDHDPIPAGGDRIHHLR
jgi:hypothetical protein